MKEGKLEDELDNFNKSYDILINIIAEPIDSKSADTLYNLLKEFNKHMRKIQICIKGRKEKDNWEDKLIEEADKLLGNEFTNISDLDNFLKRIK